MALKKTPSYLKGLADRYCRTKAEAEAHLLSYNTAMEMMAYHQQLAAAAEQGLKEAQLKLASLDLLIRDYNSGLDTQSISPVRAWKDRYGKRGQMELDTLSFVRESGTVGVTSAQVYEIFASRMGWPLNGPLVETYKQNRTRCVLKRLQLKGLVQAVDTDGQCRWVATEFIVLPSSVQAKVLAQFQ